MPPRRDPFAVVRSDRIAAQCSSWGQRHWTNQIPPVGTQSWPRVSPAGDIDTVQFLLGTGSQHIALGEALRTGLIVARRTADSVLFGSDGVRGATLGHRRRSATTGGRLFAMVPLVVLALLTGCGSGSVTLPDRTALPSISLPARPTALPTVPRRTETATATATATATVTVSESSAPPAETTPAASPTSTPTSESSGSDGQDGGLWWLLVLLAVVAGLVVAGVLWWRSRNATKEIDRRFDLVRSELAWADEDLLPRVLASPSTAEAAGLWQAGRPRLLVVEEELRQLAVAASSQDRQDRAKQWRTALASLVTAVDAETSLSPSADSERLRAARAQVEEARRDLMSMLNGADTKP